MQKCNSDFDFLASQAADCVNVAIATIESLTGANIYVAVWAILASLRENLTCRCLRVVHTSLIAWRYGKFRPIYRIWVIAVSLEVKFMYSNQNTFLSKPKGFVLFQWKHCRDVLFPCCACIDVSLERVQSLRSSDISVPGYFGLWAGLVRRMVRL